MYCKRDRVKSTKKESTLLKWLYLIIPSWVWFIHVFPNSNQIDISPYHIHILNDTSVVAYRSQGGMRLYGT